MSRVLAVDLGAVRVGLAVSDPDRVLAQPFAVIGREGAEDEIAFHITQLEVTQLVVGIPFRLDGTSGVGAEEAEAFAHSLEVRTGVPVELWDERLSTKEAERAMRRGGKKAKQQRGVVDKVAAALILQSYLDLHRAP